MRVAGTAYGRGMDDRTPARPETTWGVIRTVIQAATGVAFTLEDMPRIGLFLFAVAAATLVYETVVRWRWEQRVRPPTGHSARVGDGTSPGLRTGRRRPASPGRGTGGVAG